jgi:hypothetical protein
MRYVAARKASTNSSQLVSGFQLALFWSSILRSPSGELRMASHAKVDRHLVRPLESGPNTLNVLFLGKLQARLPSATLASVSAPAAPQDEQGR